MIRPAFRGPCLATLLIVLAGCAGASPRPATPRPNLLFIFADDQAAWTMGPGRDPQFRTRHLDRIVREGAWMSRAFVVTPVCSPSRATLLTGRYGSEVGLTDWIHLYKEPSLGLDPRVTTWPGLLRDHGYTTGLVGKWHLGRLKRFHPTRYGYDHYMGTITARDANVDPVLEADGRRRPLKGFMPELFTDEAIRFIRRHRDRPFALCVNFRVPHKGSWRVPEPLWASFRNRDVRLPAPAHPDLDVARARTEFRRYLCVVDVLDRSVGRILDALDESGLADRTIVVHTSDHGFNVGHHALTGKGNADWMLLRQEDPRTWPDKERPNLFDTSIRVPCAVRWPGVIPPGTVVRRTVTNLDWFPTILAMAGVDRPNVPSGRGRNFLPLLRGETIDGWDDDLYGEYSPHADARHDHMRMWRTPEWKLVRHFTWPRRDELYHLAEDPGETKNLIRDSRPPVREVLRELHGRILARMRELGDPVLEILEQEHPEMLRNGE